MLMLDDLIVQLQAFREKEANLPVLAEENYGSLGVDFTDQNVYVNIRKRYGGVSVSFHTKKEGDRE